MVGIFVAVLGRMLESSTQLREIWNLPSVFGVTLHRAVAEPQGKSRIWGLGETTFGEAGLGDLGAVVMFDSIHLVVVLLTDSTGMGINRAHQHDKRIG